MIPSGRARQETEIVDLSTIMATGLKGINAVAGITERGKIGETKVIGNWNEFTKHFGGLVDFSDFPLYCKRALDRGGLLRVTRIGHYTDIDDIGTLEGASSTAAADTSIEFEATSIGEWGDGLTLEIADSVNGADDQVDIKITLEGYPQLDTVVTNLNYTLTQEDVDKFNAQSNLVSITAGVGETFSTSIDSSITLSGGSYSEASIEAADYTGSVLAGNGLHAFDNDFDFVKIAIPEKADPELDAALVTYVENRMDCRAVLRTPIGISGDTAIEYRERTGSYTGTLIDSWYADLYYGDIEINNPNGYGTKNISVIGDVLGALTSKDNNSFEWFSVGGSKRGRIKNAISMGYNLGSAARSDEFDRVDIHGINAVINDKDFGIVIWGNSTLQKADTLLKFSNVGDLLIYLERGVSPLIKSEFFDPNDIETWKNIYRKVRPFLQRVKDNRGIWDFEYQGDQLIDNVEDAVVNEPSNIDSGQYIINLWIQPKVALKYVGLRVIVTNSGVSFEDLQEQV